MKSSRARLAHLEKLWNAADEHVPMAPQHVGKLDAARRVLQAGLRAWFANEDPLAVHALVAAAHEVLSNIAKNRGIADALFDSPMIKPEYLGLFRAVIRKPANFLKHADRDPNDKLNFNPSVNDLRFLYCVLALQELGEPFTPLERAFTLRIGLEYPSLLVKPMSDLALGSTAQDWARVARMPRPRFLDFDQSIRRAAEDGFNFTLFS